MPDGTSRFASLPGVEEALYPVVPLSGRLLAGFDIQVGEEGGTLELMEECWAGILLSAGVSVLF